MTTAEAVRFMLGSFVLVTALGYLAHYWKRRP